MLSAKWLPFCLCLNVLNEIPIEFDWIWIKSVKMEV